MSRSGGFYCEFGHFFITLPPVFRMQPHRMFQDKYKTIKIWLKKSKTKRLRQ